MLISVRLGASILLSILCSFGVVAQQPFDIDQLTPKAAFEKGALLRAQFKDKEARGYLQYAAEGGNVNAQYLYAISLLTYHPSSRYQPVAVQYLLEAAKSGYRSAMFELYNQPELLSRAEQAEWKQRYLESLLELAKTEPSDANFYLYQFYNQDHGDEEKAEVYFEQALKAEQPLAMYEQAVNLQKGEGFYFFQSNRFEDMSEWL